MLINYFTILDSVDKDDIIKALMVRDDEGRKKKKRTTKIDIKHADFKSRISMEDKKAAFNLQFNSHENNPEFTADFRTAIVKVLAKMNEDPTNPENKILNLLVSNEKKLHDEINKVSFIF